MNEQWIVFHYRLLTRDGSLIDETEVDAPLCISLEESGFPAALVRCLRDLSPGDEVSVDLPTEIAYGPYDPDKIQRIDWMNEPPVDLPAAGEMILFEMPSGEEVPGRLASIAEDGHVMIDFNHPLAGYDLVFYLQMISCP